MKAKLSSIVGLLAVVVLVVSFMVPAKMATPAAVEADPGLMEWTIVDTPDSEAVFVKALYTPMGLGAEIIKQAVGSDGNTIYALVRARVTSRNVANGIELRVSTNGGRSWTGTKHSALARAMNIAPASDVVVWDIAVAPDDPKIAIVAAANRTVANGITQSVWITTDGGSNWDNTQWPPVAVPVIVPGTDLISTLDVSMDFGTAREILVGTRDGKGAGTNNLCTMKMPGYGGWNVQDTSNPFTGDVIVPDSHPPSSATPLSW